MQARCVQFFCPCVQFFDPFFPFYAFQAKMRKMLMKKAEFLIYNRFYARYNKLTSDFSKKEK
jgi:hypothetical protein